jgi:hypothetical protein
VIGLRTFWDLTEHWNLRIEGDYGGFGVDDNHETYNFLGLIGYRFRGWGVGWNARLDFSISGKIMPISKLTPMVPWSPSQSSFRSDCILRPS